MRTEAEIRARIEAAVDARRQALVWALQWVLGEQDDPDRGEPLPPSGPWLGTWDPAVRERLRASQPRGSSINLGEDEDEGDAGSATS